MLVALCTQLSVLLAENDTARMPVPKAILGIVFFGAIGVGSLAGVFASNKTLLGYAGIIGTSNPTLARMLCVFGVVVGSLGATLFALNIARVI